MFHSLPILAIYQFYYQFFNKQIQSKINKKYEI